MAVHEISKMQAFGLTTISEFLDDRVVFRNLEPIDVRLPGLEALREILGIQPARIPRKTDIDYAQVIVQILQAAQSAEIHMAEIDRVVFIGDTRFNDGTAFANICLAGGWPGIAFIGSENMDQPAKVEMSATEDGYELYLANRWAAIEDFDCYCRECGLPIDGRCVVILDLDKTVLGARGRNGHVIDHVRLQAVHDTVANVLGPGFDKLAFRTAYELFNQVEYHPFTSDNQDYLAYICLIVGSGLYTLDQVVDDLRVGRIHSFLHFIEYVEHNSDDLTSEVSSIHGNIYSRVRSGDPTPFKVFRYNEYWNTVGCMGRSQEEDSVSHLLQNEIVITQEVRQMALRWKERGALLFGLSDKPDEASLPSPELVVRGYLPIHRVQAWAVGNV